MTKISVEYMVLESLNRITFTMTVKLKFSIHRTGGESREETIVWDGLASVESIISSVAEMKSDMRDAG